MPSLLARRLYQIPGGTLVPLGTRGEPVTIDTGDVVQWGKAVMFGNNIQWTVARLQDGTVVNVVAAEQTPRTLMPRKLPKAIPGYSVLREAGIVYRWAEPGEVR